MSEEVLLEPSDPRVKRQNKMMGLVILVLSSGFYLTFLFASLDSQEKIPNVFQEGIIIGINYAIPFLILLVLITLFFEVGRYFLRNDTKMTVTGVTDENWLNKTELEVHKSLTDALISIIPYAIIGTYILGLVLVVIATFYSGEWSANWRTHLIAGYGAVYILVLRPLIKWIFRSVSNSSLDFLISPAFWIGFFFFIFGIIALSAYPFLHPAWVLGVLFIILGIMALFGVVFYRNTAYRFENDNLVLLLPKFFSLTKTPVSIPLSEITSAKRITRLEDMAIQQSFSRQHVLFARTAIDFVSFMQDMSKRPIVYYSNSGSKLVYLSGKEIFIVISVGNPDNLVNTINNFHRV